MSKRIIVGITGASGAIYAKRFVELACDLDVELALIPSKHGLELLRYELQPTDNDLLSIFEFTNEAASRITLYSEDDFSAGPASGTYPADGMVIIPCSMKTLAAVAHGYADNLLTRCADVQLKERRPLVIVPRESPMSIIHLENLVGVARAGACIVPASPPFYHRPQSITDLVDVIVYKALAQLGLNHPKAYQWEG